MQLGANFVLGEAFFAIGCGQSDEKNNEGQDKICHNCAEV